jgi:Aldo/keto reductase family
MGTMMFGEWGTNDHDESIRIIHRALDASVMFVDTADVYSAGASEVITGQPTYSIFIRAHLTAVVNHAVPGLAPVPRSGRQTSGQRAAGASRSAAGAVSRDRRVAARQPTGCGW